MITIFHRIIYYETETIPSVCRLFLRDLSSRIEYVHVFYDPKMFHGYVECSFDNPAEKFLLKILFFFAQSPKRFIYFSEIEFWEYQFLV